jgi:sec-independent protein translocase protein TatB
MDFFGVGPVELLLILLVTLIVVGPRRLPEMAAQLARFLRAFRRYTANVTREFNETLHELEQEYDEMRGEWKDVGQGLDESARAVSTELEAADREARQALEEAKAADDASEPVPRSP